MKKISYSILFSAIISGLLFQVGLFINFSPDNFCIVYCDELVYFFTAGGIIFTLVSVLNIITRDKNIINGIRYFALGWLIGFFLPGVLLLLYTLL